MIEYWMITGVVKFVGLLDENVIAPSVHVGVHLDENGEFILITY